MVAFSIIVPTCGRPTLAQTLESILGAGAAPLDEILIVGDGPQELARAIAKDFTSKLQINYLETPPDHAAGHPQRNFAMKVAAGTHLLSIDDDDAYRPGSLQRVRKEASEDPGRFLIFKMESHTSRHPWGKLWKNHYPSLGNVGTPMMVAPNVAAKLGKWGHRYAGDFDFLESTLQHYPEGARWIDDVIVDVY